MTIQRRATPPRTLQQASTRAPSEHHGREQTVLVLQGGGALGAYQAGAYEALHAAGHRPDWLAGISIGAINAAIIAGNPLERRVERLRTFWERVSTLFPVEDMIRGDLARSTFNELSAWITASFGIPGFFRPRVPPAYLLPPGAAGAISLYDTEPLAATLTELVDFDLLLRNGPRLSVGAVNMRSGNFAYFDSERGDLGPRHILASSALPPGFPPVEIDGEFYWDGGLVSNTPLQYVLEKCAPRDLCVFQIDLFNARGALPRTLFEVALREKGIRYSSRTRHNTDQFREAQTMRRAVHRLLQQLPEALRQDPDAQRLAAWSSDAAVTIVHLIHRPPNYETYSLDYEFSRLSVEEHWKAGYDDVVRTLNHETWRSRRRPTEGVAVFDLTRLSGD